jgi:hypothetical protein
VKSGRYSENPLIDVFNALQPIPGEPILPEQINGDEAHPIEKPATSAPVQLTTLPHAMSSL